MIPQDIIRAAVPFDGRHAELNAEQQAALARDYPDLSAGDEPPFPMYGLRHVVRPLVRFADTWEPVGLLVARRWRRPSPAMRRTSTRSTCPDALSIHRMNNALQDRAFSLARRQCTSTGYVPRILKNPHALRSSSSAWRTFSVSGWPSMSM